MKYNLIGQRNLRKYTAPKMSPTYAAAIDAQLIVDSLCGVPWETVAEKEATMTYHTEESVGEVDGNKVGGLEMNVRIRNQFDAALFCADHSVSTVHTRMRQCIITSFQTEHSRS